MFRARPRTWSFLAVVVFLPALRSTSCLCDTWPAWAVYASSPARVLVQIRDTAVDDLPESLRNYVEPRLTLDGWSWFRIERWSLDATKSPLYPQDRFQLGVASAISSLVDPESETLRPPVDYNLRLIRHTPSNRWTGKRFQEEFRFTRGWPGAMGEAFLLNWTPRSVNRRSKQDNRDQADGED